jgi:hypothetical protein
MTPLPIGRPVPTLPSLVPDHFSQGGNGARHDIASVEYIADLRLVAHAWAVKHSMPTPKTSMHALGSDKHTSNGRKTLAKQGVSNGESARAVGATEYARIFFRGAERVWFQRITPPDSRRRGLSRGN